MGLWIVQTLIVQEQHGVLYASQKYAQMEGMMTAMV